MKLFLFAFYVIFLVFNDYNTNMGNSINYCFNIQLEKIFYPYSYFYVGHSMRGQNQAPYNNKRINYILILRITNFSLRRVAKKN